MDKSLTLDCYLWYMWNRWDKEECSAVFAYESERIWRKWEQNINEYLRDGAPAPFYANLTPTQRTKLVERAVAYYNS